MWLILVVLLVLVVLLGAELALSRSAARRAARTIGDRIGGEVEVKVLSWPALFRLATAGGARLRVVAVDVPVPDRDATIDEVVVELDRVRFSPPGLLSSAGGTFSTRIGQSALLALTPVPGLRGVEVTSSGVRYELPGGIAVHGQLTVSDGFLVFTPTSGPLGVLSIVHIAAPPGRLPLDARIEELRCERGWVIAEGPLGEHRIELRS